MNIGLCIEWTPLCTACLFEPKLEIMRLSQGVAV
jgi:hypothetical protein